LGPKEIRKKERRGERQKSIMFERNGDGNRVTVWTDYQDGNVSEPNHEREFDAFSFGDELIH
jgi:hypothetical protein